MSERRGTVPGMTTAQENAWLDQEGKVVKEEATLGLVLLRENGEDALGGGWEIRLNAPATVAAVPDGAANMPAMPPESGPAQPEPVPPLPGNDAVDGDRPPLPRIQLR